MAEDKEGARKGFAGFDSMVSDIEENLADLVKTAKPRVPKNRAEPAIPHSIATSRPELEAPRQETTVYSALVNKTERAARILWWIIGIAFVIGLVNSGNNSPKRSSATSYSSSSSPPVPAYKPPSNGEEKPQIGSGQLFSSAQIRYCLSEKIRLRGMERLVNNYSSSSVDGFNQYVNDYNARCSNFRYRRGTLESVTSEIESQRAELESEGVGRALVNP